MQMLLLQRFVPGNVWIVEQKKLRAHLKEIATDIACKCGREEKRRAVLAGYPHQLVGFTVDFNVVL